MGEIARVHVTVAAIAERDGRFLMVEEQADGRCVYNQPAGHLDEGEGLIEAVVRETLEETAWHFEPHTLVGLYLWKNPALDVSYLRACFYGHCVAHDPARALDDGIVQALWLSRAELAAASDKLRSPLVLACVDDYLTGQRYPLGVLNHILAP